MLYFIQCLCLKHTHLQSQNDKLKTGQFCFHDYKYVVFTLTIIIIITVYREHYDAKLFVDSWIALHNVSQKLLLQYNVERQLVYKNAFEAPTLFLAHHEDIEDINGNCQHSSFRRLRSVFNGYGTPLNTHHDGYEFCY